MFVALFSFAIVLGLFLIFLVFSDRININIGTGGILLVLSILIFTYGLSSVLALVTKSDLEYDMKMYLKAKTEIEMIESTEVSIPIEVISEYWDDISHANNLVMKSRKYHDNWYLKQFYYKEIAELPLLKCDSTKLKVSI